MLDTYHEQCTIIAERDDLIIGFCISKKKIFQMKERGESPHLEIQKRHLRDWPDNTSMLKQGGYLEAISKFKRKRRSQTQNCIIILKP